MILAGISIATLTGENGLLSKATTAKEETKKAEIREEIELAIAAIQAEELQKGNKVTLETLAGSEEEPGQLENSKDLEGITAKLNGKQITGEYKGYDYTIDENLKVRIGDSVTGINIKYELSTTEHTNKDITLKVTAESTNGGNVNITAPEGIEKNDEGYTISRNGTYIFTATDGAESKTSHIIISNIDKLAPLDFTPIVTNSGTSSLTIKANAQDAQADEENVKSGIEKYEYFIKNKSGSQFTKYESNEDTYIFKKLETGVEYSIYVITYDKAGNSNTSEEIYATTKIGPKDIYIDSANGNDETGDGTQESPFSTLNKITETGIIKNGLVYNIHLQDGEYIIPSYYGLIELSNDKEINIFGNKQNTKLILPSDGVGSNAGSGGTDAYSINFYRMIIELEDSTTRANYWCCANNLTFNNVVFINKMANGMDILYINKKTSKVLLNNCTFLENDFVLRCDGGGIKATNCYGTLKSGYATTDEDWNYQTNYITKTPQVNNETYRIIDQESLWKNVGTGINPDGSQANLGVYGGQYSWED